MDINQLNQIGSMSQGIDGHLARRFLSIIDKAKNGMLTIDKAKLELRKLSWSYSSENFDNKDYIVSVMRHVTKKDTHLTSL